MNLSENSQVRFITKEKKYAIPQQVYDIKSLSTVVELNKLVNLVIQTARPEHKHVEFQFVVNGYLLKESLIEHLEVISEDRGEESILELEYFSQIHPPKPFNSLECEDWVSALNANDEYVLSGCYDGSVHIWSLNPSDHKLTIPAHKGPVKTVFWLNEKQLSKENVHEKNTFLFISTSFDETICLWAWNSVKNTVEKIKTLKGHRRSVDCAAVHADTLITGSYDNQLKLWVFDGNQEIAENDDEIPVKKAKVNQPFIKAPYVTLAGHAEGVTGVCWMAMNSDASNLPDVASCSFDNTIRIWDMEAFSQKQLLKGSKAFLSMDYSPLNKLLVTGSCDNYVRLFDSRANEGSIVKAGYTGHSGWISSVCWKLNDANQFLSGSFDSSVKQWDVRSTKAPIYELLGHEERVLAVDWSNTKYILSGSADCHIKIFSL